MKKIRYFPFGYHMVDGKIVLRPEESALLQELFSGYLNGASLQQLADYAEGTGIRFRENAEHWNKNIIARMLDDERYWSAGDFPPIVSKEIGTAVTSMRKRKATAQSPIMFIQKKLVCSHCGEGVRRITQRPPRIRWDCKKCGKRTGTTDNDLLQAVTDKLLAICHDPQSTERKSACCNSLSIQAARLTNEINQAMNQREVDPNELLPLILECAAEKYKTCSIKEADHLTITLKALFQAHSNDTTLDRELFERAVKQVILQPDASVQLRLLNDIVV